MIDFYPYSNIGGIDLSAPVVEPNRITGVGKPKGCGGCFLIKEVCNKWQERNWGAPPPDDCPIVQMPKFGTLLEAVELMYQEELQNGESMENA